jgi:hypothetical protein
MNKNKKIKTTAEIIYNNKMKYFVRVNEGNFDKLRQL